MPGTESMHPALQLVVFWVAAFVTLSLAVVLTNIYADVIGSDFALLSLRSELVIAGVVSLIEAASVWAVLRFLPAAARALILTVLVVGLIYKLTHLETWSHYDIALVLAFQGVLGGAIAFVVLGNFLGALALAGGFAVFLAILASVVRSV